MAVALFVSVAATACAGTFRPGPPGAAGGGEACFVGPHESGPAGGASGSPAGGASGSPAGGLAGGPAAGASITVGAPTTAGTPTVGTAPTEPPAAERPIVVALPGPVDPSHAPVPRTPAERFAFAQLYETLVRLDCEGRPEPGLADSWRAEEGGRRWTFTLRGGARDLDGDPVTASSVGSSWVAALEGGAGRGDARAASFPGFTSITALDARTLRVELDRPVAPEFFAWPALSVRTGRDQTGWPIGTGPYRPLTEALESGVPGGPLTSILLQGPAAVELRAVPGDGRDALDAGVDLMVTSDPSVLQYARATGGFSTPPLAWDRSYLLVTGAAARRDGDPDASPDSAARREGDPEASPTSAQGPVLLHPPASALEALARDAVRVDARPASELPGLDGCLDGEAVDAGAGVDGLPAFPAPGTAGPRSGRIVYPADDAVARSLAERLVALALAPSRPDAAWLATSVPELAGGGARPRSVGLSDAAFTDALRAGGDAAYLLPLEGSAGLGGCDAVAAAIHLAPWLRAAPTDPGDGLVPAILPLVETRSTLVLRHGIGGVRVDGLGVLRLDRLHRLALEGGR